MKQKNSSVWIVGVVLVVAVVGVAVYFGNTKTEKGAFRFIPSTPPVPIIDLPDLKIDKIDTSFNPDQTNTTKYFYVTVRNIGPRLPCENSGFIDLNASIAGDYSKGSSVVRGHQLRNWTSWQKCSYDRWAWAFTLPAQTSVAGSIKKATITIDGDNRVSELNETNNSMEVIF